MSADELSARFEAVLARDGAALRRVAESYQARGPQAEDLFQEICLAVWQALPRFRGESSERTFVFRIAHNRAITALSRARPGGETLEAAAEVAVAGGDPLAEAVARERRDQLRRGIATLPLGLRQVLTLALEDLSMREIAEVLGISEGNVGVRLTRARQALREALGRDGGGKA